MTIARKTAGFIGNGSSAIMKADAEESHGGAVSVGYTLTGTWSGVTATVQFCADTTTSPLVFTNTAMAYTATSAGTWTIPVGVYFKVTVSAAGSPLPNLKLAMVGPIERV